MQRHRNSGIRAKPILVLIPVVESLSALDLGQGPLKHLATNGGANLVCRGDATARRLTGKTDAERCNSIAVGSSEIVRHLAFYDYLRAHPALAAEYDQVKALCQHLHPNDSHTYGDCKDLWIRDTEAKAIEWSRVH